MKKLIYAVLTSLSICSFFGCEKNEEISEDNGYKYGIFVVNEGSFNSNNGSVSFVNEDNTEIINDIFNAANGRPLGDIVQSFSIVNDSLGIIVVNNSAKIEIVRLADFHAVMEPVRVNYPRYFTQVNEQKGYLTSGNLAGKIYVFDLNSMVIFDSIDVGYGPEVMVMLDDRIYVANSGGWSSDSTLSIINTQTDQVEDIFYVEKVPVDLETDKDNNIWVYCKGYTNYSDIETDSYIQKIRSADGTVIWQGNVGSALDYTSVPAKFAKSNEGSELYYLRPDGVYALQVEDPVIAENPLIPGNFYGIEVHPRNGRIYVFESSFTGNGTMKIFEADGTPVAQGIVGIGPNGAVFNLQ